MYEGRAHMTMEKVISGDFYDHNRRQFRQNKNLDLEHPDWRRKNHIYMEYTIFHSYRN